MRVDSLIKQRINTVFRQSSGLGNGQPSTLYWTKGWTEPSTSFSTLIHQNMNPTSQCDQWPLQLQELCSGFSRQLWWQDQNNASFSLSRQQWILHLWEPVLREVWSISDKDPFLGVHGVAEHRLEETLGKGWAVTLAQSPHLAQRLPPENNNPTWCSSLEMYWEARRLGESTSSGPSHWGHSLPSVALIRDPKLLDSPS